MGVGTGDEGTEATWDYSANGKVTTVIDGNGNRAQLRYDGHDRQDRWTFPSATRPSSFDDSTPVNALATAGSINTADYEEYGYDAVGNRTSLRKRDGSVLNYQYDNLNRMTLKTVPERTTGSQALSSAQTRDVYYGYDLRNAQTYARFDSATGEGVTNAYDGFGRLTSATSTMGGVTRTLSYQYDAAGNRTRITYPDSISFDTAYDALNRQYMMSPSGSSWMAYSFYTAAGNLSATDRINVHHYLSYDGIQRLSQLMFQFGYSGLTLDYTRNAAGQIASMTRDYGAFGWTGHYAVNRGYTTNGLHQYSAAGSASFVYDANGNLTSDGASSYVYDIENRLVSASGAHGAALAYDPLGRLWQVTNTVTGAVTRFLYDGDALVAEYDGSNAMLRRHVHWHGADVPLATYEGADLSTLRQLEADERGSIIFAADTTGNGFTINTYDEYGIPGAGNQGRFQYTGQAWLAELGMYYYKARIYSPTLGRFMQTDPIGYGDQFNLYAYVGDDPVNRSDPSGQYECRTANACAAAEAGAKQIRMARDFYRSPATGSRIARSASAASALDRVLSSLGTRGDGGANITLGTLRPDNPGEYDPETNTITLDTHEISRSGLHVGEVLGHEVQHSRERNENLDRLATEARPIMIEGIIRATPSGSWPGVDIPSYVRDRLNSAYCRMGPRICNGPVNEAIDEEGRKPF